MTTFKSQFKLPNIVRICAECNSEQKIDQSKLKKMGWDITHGDCERHFENRLKSFGLDNSEIKIEVDEFKNMAPPCADLSDPKNKPLLNWLNNPTNKE